MGASPDFLPASSQVESAPLFPAPHVAVEDVGVERRRHGAVFLAQVAPRGAPVVVARAQVDDDVTTVSGAAIRRFNAGIGRGVVVTTKRGLAPRREP